MCVGVVSQFFSLAASHAAAALKVEALFSCVYAERISLHHTVKYKCLTCQRNLICCLESLLSQCIAVSLLSLVFESQTQKLFSLRLGFFFHVFFMRCLLSPREHSHQSKNEVGLCCYVVFLIQN